MKLVVTGTDTGIGKTLFSAALVGALGAGYWKPIQAGLEDGSDAGAVAALVPGATILPEAYRLATPCSPHRAAELDDVAIDLDALVPPAADPLVIEGAGGALVPVTRTCLYADLFARWQLPVVIVARTALGTINHSLLTIEALRARGVPILGIAFSGDAVEDSEATIAAIGRVKRLGRLPTLASLAPEQLAAAFAAAFDIEDFR
ncbi:dethiobiotin synthase [Allosphingosinicella deserti]|uniref:ATP-dependent dethiobiotin synthetase BioD n=1 Tax=Allosphingosinicella deserti TaxID=2116704 RepID=A0A2P7QLH8_9SPHN|nr:dethiobiotin synthase [Sphingomonas deserti]PSJ38800.1 ATP-dependent dethiobiotin synthetase BioD [Sphingomonas deserti]